MEEDIFYCGEAVSNLDEAWSCFVTKKRPGKSGDLKPKKSSK